ncbi:hypothetical protein BL241_20350 [Ralstonia solanacearum]|nr:hypothetical protein BL241_20350 [Ralstonia solanacearum]
MLLIFEELFWNRKHKMSTFVAELFRRVRNHSARFDAIEVFLDRRLDDFDVRQIENYNSGGDLVLYFTERIGVFALTFFFFGRFDEKARGILGARTDSIDAFYAVDALFQ